MAGTFMAIVQASTLFVGGPTLYYVFFSAIEIPCLLFIVWTAWRWAEPPARGHVGRHRPRETELR